MTRTFEWLTVDLPIADMECVGCKVGSTSYCITFDHRYPHLGYRLSRQTKGDKTLDYDRSFASLDDAKAAAEGAMS